MDILKQIINWSNENAGFISVIVFILTLLIAKVSGLFSAIRKKPKFQIDLIEAQTFGCIFDLQRTHNGFPVNKTSFAIYLRVTNIGNAPSSIGK
jgi:TPP-dependent trihydroxycyclohexane-1,2-dione (THcHDO) dehydratase